MDKPSEGDSEKHVLATHNERSVLREPVRNPEFVDEKGEDLDFRYQIRNLMKNGPGFIIIYICITYNIYYY